MSSIQPSSGSNYNPFRTENDKPTSDAPITDMGKFSGDYGKTGNWFFRKVYDSVAALFSGKYWKGGWFSPKQSGDDSDAAALSGRISSALQESWRGDAEAALKMSPGEFRTASALEQIKGLDTRDKIDARRAQEATLKSLGLSAQDAASYQERTGAVSQQIDELNKNIGELIVAAKNPDIESNYKDIRKDPKKKLADTLARCNEGLVALSKSSYSPSEVTIAQLDDAGLSYNSATNTIEQKKK